ncbi:MAG: XRE family transcriptional regulator [Ruminococcus sp.]|nr:XRE family transcriptional regulator [Ruminococcus sp.]
MTLGDIVKNYRTEHGLSLREFSRISGVSNGYISMLEKNEHPKTKKPIVPSIEKMRCIANAMGMSFDSLLDMIDSNQPISIKKENAPAPSLTSSESDLLSKYRRLNSEGRKKLVERADELFDLGYVEKGDAEKMA